MFGESVVSLVGEMVNAYKSSSMGNSQFGGIPVRNHVDLSRTVHVNCCVIASKMCAIRRQDVNFVSLAIRNQEMVPSVKSCTDRVQER